MQRTVTHTRNSTQVLHDCSLHISYLFFKVGILACLEFISNLKLRQTEIDKVLTTWQGGDAVSSLRQSQKAQGGQAVARFLAQAMDR